MRKVLISLGVAAAAAFGSVAAHADVLHVDFSSFSNGAAVSSLAGVAFDMSGGPVASTTPTIWAGGGTFNLLTNSATAGNYPTASQLRATFDGVADGLSFVFYNAGWSDSGRGNSFYSAFDSLGNLLETGSLQASESTLATFTLGVNGVHSIVFDNNTGGNDSWWFGLSSLDARDVRSDVPEPASLALAGLALLGVVATRRKSAVR